MIADAQDVAASEILAAGVCKMKNVLVVFNYNAGRKQAVLYKKNIHKFLFKRCNKFKFISIEEFGETDLNEYDTIFAVGGDGTVNKVAKTAVEQNKSVAIIPSGTANLLAIKLGIPSNLRKALRVVDEKCIKEIDFIDISGNPCFLRCGIGYDSDIICKTPQSLKNKYGYFAYFIAGIIFALRLKTELYKISYDGNELTTDATCIIVANAANMYRNMVSIAQSSEKDDGFADVFILKAKNPVTFFAEFLKIIFGAKKDNSRALYFQAHKMTIKNNWTLCHIDGEKMKLKDDIEIEVLPRALKVY